MVIEQITLVVQFGPFGLPVQDLNDTSAVEDMTAAFKLVHTVG
jgi:hypothetical protein